MNKLYGKSKLGFALAWIGIYIVLASIADGISEDIGIQKIITAPLLMLLSVFLFIWIRKNGYKSEFGLVSPKLKAKECLYYIPLFLLMSLNLWHGVKMNFKWHEALLYIISMVFVGFLEEVIFRGFLFGAMKKDGVKSAFAVSSVTFGLGHIINLLNGAELFSTVLQIISAIAVGFMFTAVFYKTGSLVMCVITHSVINSLSAFTVEGSVMYRIVTNTVICAISVGYALLVLNKKNEKENI